MMSVDEDKPATAMYRLLSLGLKLESSAEESDAARVISCLQN